MSVIKRDSTNVILNNLVLLVGALFFEWSPANIVAMYWIKSQIESLFAIFKSVKIGGKVNSSVPSLILYWGVTGIIVSFFIVWIFQGFNEENPLKAFNFQWATLVILLLLTLNGIKEYLLFIKEKLNAYRIMSYEKQVLLVIKRPMRKSLILMFAIFLSATPAALSSTIWLIVFLFLITTAVELVDIRKNYDAEHHT